MSNQKAPIRGRNASPRQPQLASQQPARSTYLWAPIQFRPKHEGIRDQGQPDGPHVFHRFSNTEKGAQSRRATRTALSKGICQLAHPHSESVKRSREQREQDGQAASRGPEGMTTRPADGTNRNNPRPAPYGVTRGVDSHHASQAKHQDTENITFNCLHQSKTSESSWPSGVPQPQHSSSAN